MISEASGSVLSSAASLSTSLKQEEMLSGKACVATSRGSVVGNATTELDSGRPLKKVKDEGGQKHYGEKDERDLEEDDQGDDPEDVHLAGQKPERRPWSRREDDAVTRLVGDDTRTVVCLCVRACVFNATCVVAHWTVGNLRSV